MFAVTIITASAATAPTVAENGTTAACQMLGLRRPTWLGLELGLGLREVTDLSYAADITDSADAVIS